jgi:threonine 3-dehydrogenase
MRGNPIGASGIFAEKIALRRHGLLFKSLILKVFHKREMFATWYKTSSTRVPGPKISPGITHCWHPTEFGKGMARMMSGKSGKIVLDWTG